MNYLALDIGGRRTGLAFGNDEDGVAVALPTIEHRNFEQLLQQVQQIVESRQVRHLVLGLPRLPSGDEGEQCQIVRGFADILDESGIPYSFVDERYTSYQAGVDTDASAATQILLTHLERISKKNAKGI